MVAGLKPSPSPHRSLSRGDLWVLSHVSAETLPQVFGLARRSAGRRVCLLLTCENECERRLMRGKKIVCVNTFVLIRCSVSSEDMNTFGWTDGGLAGME